jgi:hypothetical protein
MFMINKARTLMLPKKMGLDTRLPIDFSDIQR